MNVLRFRPHRRRRLPANASGARRPAHGPYRSARHGRWIAFGVGAVVVGGLVAMKPVEQPAATPAALASAPTGEIRGHFEMCGRIRHTCVVDGDTIWLDGLNLRLEGYDTPEPYTDICGGGAEVALAHRASARLLDLLNANAFSVETGGLDNTGKRTLATIRIGGRDVGDILIAEGLARSWPDGEEFWCN